ncbi:putative zinc finger motif, C2HC5-type-domain-containing protein [Biscogniauxia sp. FL1348]|nr:putative zinc finger motif, C2HC5-type-domain-containing protein [Biscogniauxia sp. FL1348]
MTTHQLSRLLPLPDEELKQVLDYAATLSKSEAVTHFQNLLGDSPEVVDFISSFNSKRQDPKAAAAAAATATAPSSASADGVPKPGRPQKKKKKAALHTPAPRQVADFGLTPGTAYNKKDNEDDYISRRSSPAAGGSRGVSPAKTSTQKSATPLPTKLPPSAAGQLISDLSKPKPKSTPGSRSSTPGPKTKVNISGGTAMHGASTALSDLDYAIRALEITTNPTRSKDDASRRCNCVAARHPLQAAAPNCLNCGKVICVKEGLGPCTFCGTPLLSSNEVQSMIRELRAEKGREKMAIDREAHKKAEVSRTPAPFSRPREPTSEAEAKALENRDRLLGFQAQNAQRTTVRDEAADFDVSGAVAGTGGNMWASPEERARELKRQQKILREMEWNARPDYEKRKQVVSIDLVGRKIVRKMAAVERPPSSDEDDDELPVRTTPALVETSGNRGSNSGTFSKNPLLGGLIKPVFNAKGKGAPLEGRATGPTRWRRVQDDLDDNEAVILDGGVYGGVALRGQSSADDEPACG